jgi:hypothetical protein
MGVLEVVDFGMIDNKNALDEADSDHRYIERRILRIEENKTVL